MRARLRPGEASHLYIRPGRLPARHVAADGALERGEQWLTLKMLAHPDVRIYDGSWSEWSARADLPKATGATP